MGIEDTLRDIVKQEINQEISELKDLIMSLYSNNGNSGKLLKGRKECADFLGIKEKTVSSWIKNGKIPRNAYQRKGKQLFFHSNKLIT